MIESGGEHFKTLGSDVEFRVSNKYSSFEEVLTQGLEGAPPTTSVYSSAQKYHCQLWNG